MGRAGRLQSLCSPLGGAGESPPSLSEQLAAIPLHLRRVLDQLLPQLVDRTLRRSVRRQPTPQLVRLSAHDLEQLGVDYLAGLTVPQLTRQYGIHRTTILRHLERLGIDRRAQVRKLTDNQVARATKLYATGLSLAAVGGRLGVDGQTIRREFRKAGIPVRPRNGRPAPT